MLILLAGVYDLSQAAIIRAEVYNAADVMAASASNLAVQTDGSTALTLDQVQEVESSIWALIPTLRTGQMNGNPKSVTISSILFEPSPYAPCVWGQTTSCQYIADVAWSEGYAAKNADGSFAINLPSTDCAGTFTTDTATQVGPTTNLSGTDNLNFFRTLNVATSSGTFADGTELDEAGVAPILAVTIEFTYRPVFNLFIIPAYTFWVNAYWPVRSVKKATAKTVNYGFGNVTVEPLTNQFTTLVGTAGSNTVPAGSGTDVATSAYCLNPGVSNPGPVSYPVSASS
jgi:hypothetical protein